LIEVLPPGLYEAVLTPKTEAAVNPDLIAGDWLVRFELAASATCARSSSPTPRTRAALARYGASRKPTSLIARLGAPTGL
jgi:hypothetical protein